MSDFFNTETGQYHESVNDPLYTDSKYVKNPAFSPDEATVLAVTQGHRIWDEANSYVREMTQTEKDAVTDLATLKTQRLAEINGKTDLLVHTGTVELFPANGSTGESYIFSTSFVSQFNITAIRDHTADFTFPKDVTTYDQDTYALEQVDVDVLWNLMKDSVDAQIGAGRALKKQIIDATTVAEVNAIVDTR
jgi:hypothetical protein